MTQQVADVRLANKLARQKDELSRRVKEGTLDIEEISLALQLLIENRFFVNDEPDELSKIDLEGLELRQGTKVSVRVDEEPTPEGDPQKYNLAIKLSGPISEGENDGKEFWLPLEGLIDGRTTPHCLALIERSIDGGDGPRFTLQCALNKMGKIAIEWDPPREEPGVSFTLSLPNEQGFTGKCKLAEVSYFLETTGE
jgi:hypothetical protein